MNMTNPTNTTDGPHGAIASNESKIRFLADVFDRLWQRYRERVKYVRQYEEVVQRHGGKFVNDHIAFRTIAWQQPYSGIHCLSRLFEAAGYRAAGTYYFEDKFLFATHYHPPHNELPKLFISELQSWRLGDRAREIIARTMAALREPLSLELLVRLETLAKTSATDRRDLLEKSVEWIERLPWRAPQKADVQELNEQSQYGAWVLVHGNNVNHFTSLINSHGVESLNDIVKTVAALRDAGVPMKDEIEGAPGSILRQTATQAVLVDVDVSEGTQISKLPWTYAYFELAERGLVETADGKKQRFEGFLGPQATQLFEMTRKK
jgi:hypothetical protein